MDEVYPYEKFYNVRFFRKRDIPFLRCICKYPDGFMLEFEEGEEVDTIVRAWEPTKNDLRLLKMKSIIAEGEDK